MKYCPVTNKPCKNFHTDKTGLKKLCKTWYTLNLNGIIRCPHFKTGGPEWTIKKLN